MIKLFQKKNRHFQNPFLNDLHSHLLPGIDDGVKSWNESLEILKLFQEMGYKKVITTPHISMDFYPNDENQLRELEKELIDKVTNAQIELTVEVAAEYYLDENLFSRVDNVDNGLILISDKYLLFETPFFNKPANLTEFIFKVNSLGIAPIMAHPERYSYLNSDENLMEELINMGTLFQININSFGGYYGPDIKKSADRLVKKNRIHLLGSDCHNIDQLYFTKKLMSSKSFRGVINLPLQNSQL